MLNALDEEGLDSACILLINSDICHFLSEILSYHEKKAVKLISKIVCQLSETDEFFRTDFYRVLKGYLRVINSMPTSSSKENDTEIYHKDIFSCVGIIVRK